jgi:hypothetical protein
VSKSRRKLSRISTVYTFYKNIFFKFKLTCNFLSLLFITDDKYHIQNYQQIDHQQGHSYGVNNYKPSMEQHSKHIHMIEEPNNNVNGNKNNSSTSSCDDTIDYDETIQNQDSSKHNSDDVMKYSKTYQSRGHYEDPQNPYGGNSSDDYRINTNLDDKKLNNDDGNSSMNYASSDEMNTNNISSDQGDKLGSGSEDEGENIIQFKI